MIESLGFQYGIGAFETLRVTQGQPMRLERHLDRLMAALAVLELNELTRADCREAILERIRLDRVEEGVVKLMVNDLGSFTLSRARSMGDETYRAGLALSVSEVPILPQNRYTIKSTNYLVNHLEWQRARTAGFDDALMLNTGGEVAETTRSNLFVIRAGEVHTPPLSSGCLSGIMRGVLLEEHPGLIRETPMDRAFLARAEAVFVTNAVMGVMPVREIDGTEYASAVHPLVAEWIGRYSINEERDRHNG